MERGVIQCCPLSEAPYIQLYVLKSWYCYCCSKKISLVIRLISLRVVVSLSCNNKKKVLWFIVRKVNWYRAQYEIQYSFNMNIHTCTHNDLLNGKAWVSSQAPWCVCAINVGVKHRGHTDHHLRGQRIKKRDQLCALRQTQKNPGQQCNNSLLSCFSLSAFLFQLTASLPNIHSVCTHFPRLLYGSDCLLLALLS